MKTLYHNGNILTMNGEHTNAFAVEEDRFCTSDGTARQVNLEGMTVCPAFLDAHGHFLKTAADFLEADLTGAGSVAEIGARIAAFQACLGTRANDWLHAGKLEESNFPNGERLTRELLDELVPGKKLVISTRSGHSGILSSAALAALGKTPDGDGRLAENEYFDVLRQIPPPTGEDMLPAFARAQALYASHGITTVQEGLLVAEMLPMYRPLLESKTLSLDIVAYAALEELDDLLSDFPSETEHFRIGGAKIFLDGSPQERTAWLREPYAGETEYCGHPAMRDEDVLHAVRECAKRGVQLLAHANGDAAAAQFLNAVRQVSEECPRVRELRFVLIHAQIIGRKQLEEAASLGVIPSFFASHILHLGDQHLKNLGVARAESISPAGSAERLGLPFTLHTDTPVIPPDLLEAMRCAVTRRTRQGVMLSREESTSPEAALAAVTRNVAYQYGEEARRGRIAPGYFADFIVLDGDPIARPEENFSIQAVFRRGRPIFRRA